MYSAFIWEAQLRTGRRARRYIKTGDCAWSDASENVRLCTVENIPEMPVRRLLSASGQAVSKGADRKHTSQAGRWQDARPVTVRMGDGISEARQASQLAEMRGGLWR